MPSTTYKVTAPAIQCKLDDGRYVHLYQGAVLPDNVDAEARKQYVAEKLVATEAQADKALMAQPPGSGDSTTPTPAAAGETPARNASADDWRSYALANGASVDDVKDLTRDELRDKFGPK